MNYLDRIKSLIEEDDYYIQRDYYPKHRVSIYQLVKNDTDKSKFIYCELPYNLTRLLKREFNLKIETKNVSALNYIPRPVEKDHIRTWFE